MCDLFTRKHIIITALVTFIASLALFVGVSLAGEILGTGDVLNRAKHIIEENYVDALTDEQKKKMEDFALSAMVASLEDPYSFYFNEDTLNSFNEQNEEEYIGIGLAVSFNAEENKLVVVSPTDKSPAQKAGILPGDVVTRVDDIVISAETYNDAISYIKNDGKDGDGVKVYILRDKEEKIFDLKREKVSVDTVTEKMLDESVGYIRISEFNFSTVKEFEESIDALKKENAKGLVIDLRNNPGGYAESVIKMTDMLVPEGTIAYLENNKGERQYYNSDKETIDLPLAILVNEGTASAAELMAGSTQAHKTAVIVGTKTYGKAVGQSPYMLTPKTAIYLTNARYYTPLGECIDKQGIEPDIKVDLTDEKKVRLLTLDPSEDDQLKTAVEVLYDRIKK